MSKYPGRVPREPFKRLEDRIQAVKRSQGLGPELTGMVATLHRAPGDQD
jgi:hypothetical protein